MQSLRELIYFLSQYDIQPLNQHGQPLEEGSKAAMLYQGILRQKYRSDEDAERDIYPGPDSNNKYRQLKFFLRDRLLDAVGRFSAGKYKDQFTDYQFAYYDCHRQWFTIKVLAGHNAHTVAISMALKLLRQAIKFEFTLLCLDITSYLMIQYGLRDGRDRKYDEMLEQFSYYQDAYQAEMTVSKLYTMLMSQYTTSRSSKVVMSELVQAYFRQIAPFLEKYDSYHIQMYGRMIEIMTYTDAYDYRKALACCEQVIQLFQSKPYHSVTPLQVFYYQKLVCHIQLQQFDEGRITALRCFEITREGTFNWFKSYELYFYLAMHTEAYTEAFEIVRQIHQHPRFQFLPEIMKELWSIFEHYTYFLCATGRVSSNSSYKFKAARFSNDLPKFTRDKGGMNVAIIILKLAFMIHERKEGMLLDQMEAIEQYVYRHLNEPQTRRSYIFIKMLLQVPVRNFDAGQLLQHTSRLLEELKTIPSDLSMQSYEIEIIRFEQLWELILESLRRREPGRVV
jgi:hypothetical protein